MEDSIVFEGDISDTITARITRDPTIDGGAVVADFGMSAGDRIFEISAAIPKEKEDAILAFMKESRRIYISSEQGIFIAFIESFQRNPMRIKLLVEGEA